MLGEDKFKLVDTIVLNGKVGYCETGDIAGEVIGVYSIVKVKKLDGTYIEKRGESFPFSKEMEEKVGWLNYYANIQILTGDTLIDIDHIDETKVVSMEGVVESEYYHRYSDCTGYLWTTEEFKAGGHDILQILESHIDEYIHMEIELYEKIR